MPPVRPDVVDRARLARLLADPLARRVTVLDAPAGFGKTTLLASWLAADPERAAAWVSLDERDVDSARLLAHVTAALARADPAIALALPSAGAPTTGQAALTALANGLEAAGVPVVLVLDDCHLVSGAASLEVLEFLVEHLPEPTRVVLAMRGDPTVPLGRLRARGMLREIRAHDLRFTAREAHALLHDGFGVALDAADVQRLVERTEGWPAGLCLAGLSLRDHPDPPAFVRDFAGDHRHIGEYLMEEVLRAEPPEVREFLLRTSLPARLSGALCDAMLERTGSAALLATLERRNQFLIPLDEHHEWYRYHHLFADFLRGELLAQEPELVPVLHRRAAAWLRATADVNLAIHHAAAGGAYEDAAAHDRVQRPAVDAPRTPRHGRRLAGPAARRLRGDAIPQLAAGAAWHGRHDGPRPADVPGRRALGGAPRRWRPWVGVAGTAGGGGRAAARLRARTATSATTVRAARAAGAERAERRPELLPRADAARPPLLQAGRLRGDRAALRPGPRSTRARHAIVHDSTLALWPSAEAHCGRRGARRASLRSARSPIAQHDRPSPSIGYGTIRPRRGPARGRRRSSAARPLADRGPRSSGVPSPDVTNGARALVLARVSAAAGRRRRGGPAHAAARAAAIAGAGDAAYIAARAADARDAASVPRRPSPRAPQRPRARRAAAAGDRPEPARDRRGALRLHQHRRSRTCARSCASSTPVPAAEAVRRSPPSRADRGSLTGNRPDAGSAGRVRAASDPAVPRDLALVAAFVNTNDREAGLDTLASPAARRLAARARAAGGRWRGGRPGAGAGQRGA